MTTSGLRLALILVGSSLIFLQEVQAHRIVSHYCYVDAQRIVWLGGRRVWQAYQQRQCCNGWTGCYCHIALCSPQCSNGAMCIGRHQCSCPAGYQGNRCENLHCGHYTKNCYPGTCNNIVDLNTCRCVDGFGGDDCETITDIPVLKYCSVSLSDSQRADAITGNNCLMEDVPDPDKPRKPEEVELLKEEATFFSNQKDTKAVTIDWEALYGFPNQVPIKPAVIRDVVTGLVSAKTVLNLKNSVGYSKQRKEVPCQHGGTQQNPRQSAQCRSTEQVNWLVEHGDTLEVTGSAIPGGFKEVSRNLGIGNYANISFRYAFDVAPKHIMYITFDHEPPTLVDSSTYSSTKAEALSADPEATMENSFDIKFSNEWRDEVSGLKDSKYYVFTLKPASDGSKMLEEQGDPVCNGTYKFEDGKADPKCTPKDFGLYSVIARVSDNANNYVLSRTLAAVGPNSPITRGDSFICPDANAETKYTWLNTLDPSTIQVSWKDHFLNSFLVENGYLNGIKDYKEPIQYDDKFGNLQSSGAVNHKNGITRFQSQHKVIEGKGDSQPSGSWTDLGLSDTTEIDTGTRKDGITIQVWVRAHDLFGQDIQDLLEIHVDSTEPIVKQNTRNPTFQPDVTDSILGNFASRVTLIAEDPHSGIDHFEFKLIDQSLTDSVVVENQTFPVIPASYCGSGDQTCYCIKPEGKCFKKEHPVDIDNCWFLNRKGNSFRLEGYAVNQAYLRTLFTHHLGVINSLDGFEKYPGVESLQQMSQAQDQTSVSLSWVLPRACYPRERIEVEYDINGRIQTSYDKDTTNITVTDLKPNSIYKFKVTIIYKNNNILKPSDEASVDGTTMTVSSSSDSLSGGAIFGIILGVLILILLIILIVLMLLRYRKGKSPVPRKIVRFKDNVHNRLSMAVHAAPFVSRSNSAPNNYGDEEDGQVKRQRHHVEGGVVNPGYDFDLLRRTYLGKFEDDVYAYGAMEFDTKPSWMVDKDKVRLGDEITSGRLARIRRAKVQDKKVKGAVVAKVLKDPSDEANVLLLRAKMNFLATSVPKHPNLVNLVAGVSEGPILLLEHCDYNLKTWLSEIQKVNADVVDQLLHFCLDIAKGLAHLHSNDLLHRRLAARNVLLVKQDDKLTAKLTGFGPMRGEGEDDKKEKIPVKWLAPESLEKEKGDSRHYSSDTDMWTYGITVWEIFSLGEQPYKDKGMSEMKKTHASGYILPKPEHCSEEEYNRLMKPCWKIKPAARPSAQTMVDTLHQMFGHGPMDDDQYTYGDEEQDPVYENR